MPGSWSASPPPAAAWGRASKPSPPVRPSMPFRSAWSRRPMPCSPSPAAVPVRKPSTRYSSSSAWANKFRRPAENSSTSRSPAPAHRDPLYTKFHLACRRREVLQKVFICTPTRRGGYFSVKKSRQKSLGEDPKTPTRRYTPYNRGPRKVVRPCGERRMHRSGEGCPEQSAGSARLKRRLHPTRRRL